jgi:peptidoglycan/LPS O-acetylase OafA/YrhL
VPAPRPPPLPALTGVRFLAALHVVLYHHGREALGAAPWPVPALLATGPAAVSLFYLLSGLVLVYGCTDEAGALRGTPRAFWRARFARIYPTFLAAQLLDAPWYLNALLREGATSRLLWQAPAVLLLVHAWVPLAVFAWNVPGWSISCEAFFYAAFPALARRLRGASLLWLGPLWLVTLVPPALVTWALASRAGWLDAALPTGPGGLPVREWLVRLGGFSPLARLPEFVAGMVLGQQVRARLAAAGPLGPGASAALEVGAVALLTGALVALGAWDGSKPWLDSGLLWPLFALLLCALALGQGPLGRLLASPALQRLGEASFALYILQEPVAIWLHHLPGFAAASPGLALAVVLGGLVAASLACQAWLAEPARRWLLAR